MVRFGFVVVYLGFGYALVVLAMLTTRLSGPWGVDRTLLVTAGAAVATVASFFLPAISGVTKHGFEQLNAWHALDPLSTGMVTLLAFAVALHAFLLEAGGDDRRWLVASAAACLWAIVAGNVLIQTFTTRGTGPELGLWVAVLAASVGAGYEASRLARHRHTERTRGGQ